MHCSPGRLQKALGTTPDSKMEAGFSAIDDAALSLRKDEKLVLIRCPKDFNVEGLEGQSFDLFPSKKSKTDDVVKEVKMDGRKFALRREVASLYECVRPVVTSAVSGAPCVGPAFSSVFNVTEKIALKIANTNTPLPIRSSYSTTVPQLDFLRVRAMPFGSTSHIDSSGNIVHGPPQAATSQAQAQAQATSSKEKKKEKKRKSEGSAVASASAVAVKEEAVAAVAAEAQTPSKEKKKEKKRKSEGSKH
mmetsp:Transcript_25589/g.57866  ORF Transcript_25589/g.57866 Transcript_25589/m.57866 type:complete len:248 (+) Transcript_25589:2-745(+)